MFNLFITILKRDLLLAMRRKTDSLTTIFFFIIVLSLFPISIGAEDALLKTLAPGVTWVATLLASMLSLQRLFADDYHDGSLEQMLLSPYPLSLLVTARVTIHWLITGLPMVLIAPLVALQYHLSIESLGVLMLGLLIGTPVLSLVGAIGSALTLGVRGGGVLLSVLILPLFIPVLVYGAGAVNASITGASDSMPYLMLLGAFLIVAAALAPVATAAALKISVE